MKRRIKQFLFLLQAVVVLLLTRPHMYRREWEKLRDEFNEIQ